MDWTEIARVLYPELILIIGVLATLTMSLFATTKRHVPGMSVVFLVLASFAVARDLFPASTESILFNSFAQDSLSIYFRLLIYFVTAILALGSNQYLRQLESPAEYYPIILTSALGAGMLVGANDLLFFFVALETLGLGAILLASYARLNQKSNEAGIKYLITSSVSTAILLLGISFLYGLTGLTNFDEVAFRLYQLNIIGALSPAVITLIAVCFVAAVSFKLAAVPFHNWSPDVYNGAPTVTTAFLSVVSKTAAFGLAIRLFNSVFNNELITVLFAVIAILSIIIGNYVGLIQMISRASAKRLLAYSSIAQAGYLIIGLSIFQKESIAALVMYLSVYALMNTGVFLGLIYFEQSAGTDSIYDMAGLIKKRPWMAITTSLCLINLAGLPFIPAGFIAKFYLFSSAYASGTSIAGLELGQILAVVGLLGSLVGLYYYLYLVKIMVVDEPSTAVKQLEEVDSSFCLTKLAKYCGPAQGYGLINLSMAITIVLMTGFGIFGMNWFRIVASQVVSSLS